jgi:hypothetical protein
VRRSLTGLDPSRQLAGRQSRLWFGCLPEQRISRPRLRIFQAGNTKGNDRFWSACFWGSETQSCVWNLGPGLVERKGEWVMGRNGERVEDGLNACRSTEGRCIWGYHAHRVCDQEVSARPIPCHNRDALESRYLISRLRVLWPGPAMKGAAANTWMGGETSCTWTVSAVLDRGMRLPPVW